MKTKTMTIAFLALVLPSVALAVPFGTVNYNDNITAIFGTGNPNGSWTSATGDDGVKIALRFKQRSTTNMENDGNGTYRFDTGTIVNFEFSLDSGIHNLTDIQFITGLDRDPSASVNYIPFTVEPLLLYGDNSFGTDATDNGAGVEGPYFTLGFTNTIAQNSQQLAWYGIDINQPGTYDMFITALSKSNPQEILAQTEARVVMGALPTQSVPDGGTTVMLLGCALLGVGGIRRYSRRSAA